VSKSSGIASLCGSTPAMKEVESNVSSWADSLVSLAKNKEQQATMREAALNFRREKIAGWSQVLKEDFLPIWQPLMRKEEK
jgi:hypothetical protein